MPKFLNAEGEEVKLERWGWSVAYKDGTELHQFDEEAGRFHSYSEIDRENIAMFTMSRTDEPRIRHDIVVQHDMQIFHRYVTTHDGNIGVSFLSYMFGWKKDGVIAYHFILPDDRIVMSCDKNIDLVLFQLWRGTEYETLAVQ